MGIGCSGGAAQAYQIADNYPGLLDGIVVGCSLADRLRRRPTGLRRSTAAAAIAQRHPGRLEPAEQQAVSGLPSVEASGRDERGTPGFSIRSRDFSITAVPAALRFERQQSARGRALTDLGPDRSTVYGRDCRLGARPPPARQHRRPVRPARALQRGPDLARVSFSSLNADIGGLDVDFRPTRSPNLRRRRGHRAAYRTGRVLNGGGGLSDIPIIDYRAIPVRAAHSAAGHAGTTPLWSQERLIAANRTPTTGHPRPTPAEAGSSSSGVWSRTRSSRWIVGSPP